jgi:hypothetical protein
MATYCFRCPECGTPFTDSTNEVTITCYGPEEWNHAPVEARRDYRAENVGVAVEQLKQERELGGRDAYKRLFLPHNDDFKGPGDPDGTKGMREWRETHQPKAGNKSPDWPGHVEKQVM